MDELTDMDRERLEDIITNRLARALYFWEPPNSGVLPWMREYRDDMLFVLALLMRANGGVLWDDPKTVPVVVLQALAREMTELGAEWLESTPEAIAAAERGLQ